MQRRFFHSWQRGLLVLLMLTVLTPALSFDYAAWVYDPLSWVYTRGGIIPTQQKLNNTRYAFLAAAPATGAPPVSAI